MTDDATGDEETSVGFTPRGSDVVEQLNDHTRDHEFLTELGFTIETVEDQRVEASVPHNEKYANPGMGGRLHGGVVATVLDSVMGYTLMAALGRTETRKVGPTVSLTTNFVSSADEPLVAVGEIVRIGSSTAAINGELRGQDTDRVIATGQGVWRVYDEPE